MRSPPASRPGGWARLPQGNVWNGRRRRSGGRSSGMPWHGSAIPRGRGANSTNWASSSPNSHAVHGARLSAVVLTRRGKNVSHPEEYDVVVLGSGRARFFAWSLASQGKRVAVVERRNLAGSCPTIACAFWCCANWPGYPEIGIGENGETL